MNSIPSDSVKWIHTYASLVWIFTVLNMVGFLCRAQCIDFSSLNDNRSCLPCWYIKHTEKSWESTLRKKGNGDSFIVGGEGNILGCALTSQCFLSSCHQPEVRPNYSRFHISVKNCWLHRTDILLSLKYFYLDCNLKAFDLNRKGTSLTCSAYMKT